QHPFIAPELLRVCSRSSEDLAPPRGDIATMLLVDTAGEKRRQQLVLLDPVVERVDHPIKRIPSTGPLIQRRRVTHGRNVAAASRRGLLAHARRASTVTASRQDDSAASLKERGRVKSVRC